MTDDQAEQARIEATAAIDASYAAEEDGESPDRHIARAQAYALLALSYELSWHRPKPWRP